MNATDQIKALNAGFTIIRERDVGLENRTLAIFAKTKRQPTWHNLKSGFPSKAARRRAMKKLLQLTKVIED